MGDIQDALEAFQKILQYKYNFVVSHKKGCIWPGTEF